MSKPTRAEHLRLVSMARVVLYRGVLSTVDKLHWRYADGICRMETELALDISNDAGVKCQVEAAEVSLPPGLGTRVRLLRDPITLDSAGYAGRSGRVVRIADGVAAIVSVDDVPGLEIYWRLCCMTEIPPDSLIQYQQEWVPSEIAAIPDLAAEMRRRIVEKWRADFESQCMEEYRRVEVRYADLGGTMAPLPALDSRCYPKGAQALPIATPRQAWKFGEVREGPEGVFTVEVRAPLPDISVPVVVDFATYACRHCGDTGTVLAEDACGDPFPSLCTSCRGAKVEPERWELEGPNEVYGGIPFGLLPHAREWLAVRGEEGFVFQTLCETHNGEPLTRIEADHNCDVAQVLADLMVDGEHCHEMAAARVLAALRGGWLEV